MVLEPGMQAYQNFGKQRLAGDRKKTKPGRSGWSRRGIDIKSGVANRLKERICFVAKRIQPYVNKEFIQVEASLRHRTEEFEV
jgi:hypothetical protein